MFAGPLLFVCMEHRKVLDKKQNQFVVCNQIDLERTQLHLELWTNNQKWYMLVERIQASIGCKFEFLGRSITERIFFIIYHWHRVKSAVIP